jgi:hypothetical protein
MYPSHARSSACEGVGDHRRCAQSPAVLPAECDSSRSCQAVDWLGGPGKRGNAKRPGPTAAVDADVNGDSAVVLPRFEVRHYWLSGTLRAGVAIGCQGAAQGRGGASQAVRRSQLRGPGRFHGCLGNAPCLLVTSIAEDRYIRSRVRMAPRTARIEHFPVASGGVVYRDGTVKILGDVTR